MQGALANVVKGIMACHGVVAVALLALAALLGSGRPLASLAPAIAVGLMGAALFAKSQLIRLKQQLTYVDAVGWTPTEIKMAA